MTPAPAQELIPQDPHELYGDNFEKLPEQIVNALREQVKEFQGQEKYLRRREVMRDRRNRFYERGFQHIYWNNGQQPGYTMIAPGGTAVNAAGQMVQAPRFVDSYNLYRRYLQINMAILTQTSPGIDFKPNDASRSEDLEAAESAELYRHDFDRNNDVNSIRQNTVRMFGVSGRCIRWTRSEQDAQKYGVDAQGQPRTVEITTVHGTLESKVPILSRCQAEALYVFLSDDPDVKQAKCEYPWVAEKIKPGIQGLGENAYERLARLGVLQGARSEMLSADSFTHLTTRMNCWIRPEAFTGDRYDEAFEETQEGDVDEQGQPLTLGGKIKQLFPEGVHCVFVGDVYVESCPEAIEDALCIEFPWEGDGMNREGFMESFLVVQDSFNDSMNAAREIFDTGWPSTWINAEEDEYDAIVKQRSEPYALRQKKVNVGMKTADMFFREPDPNLPATFPEFMQNLSGELPQFMLAAPPALFGQAMEDQKTASGYAQARAQAMGQQGLIFAKLQHMDATMYYQAAICASKNPDETRTILVPGSSGQTASLEVGKLTKGNFKAYPAGDSNLPESTAAKRATIDQVATLLAPTPMFQEIMNVPKNVRFFLDAHGLTEICVPQAEAYDKQMFEIEELLQGAPIPPDPMMQQQAMIDHAAAAVKLHNSGMADQPIPPAPQLPSSPSVPVNEWDFHGPEAACCQDWLNSEACRRELASGNTAGVMNVVAHWKAHVRMLQAMMPPPMPLLPPGKPQAAIPPPKPAGGPLLQSSLTPPGAPGAATM